MKTFYVYILQSMVDSSYYKGFSEQPFIRLGQHNNRECRFTSNKTPWKLVFMQSYSTKREALIREKKLKKYDNSQIAQIVGSQLNELNNV